MLLAGHQWRMGTDPPPFLSHFSLLLVPSFFSVRRSGENPPERGSHASKAMSRSWSLAHILRAIEAKKQASTNPNVPVDETLV